MHHLLSILILIFSVVLFPPTVLALISNNAAPGDGTYPIKRGLENVILTVASVNPVTKAWFSKTRSERRFEEVKILATRGVSTGNSLNELIIQTESAVSVISKVESASQKKQLLEKIQESIAKYDQGLKELSRQAGERLPASPPAISPSVTVAPQPTVTTIQQPMVSQPSLTPTPLPASSSPGGAISAEDLERERQAYEEAIRKMEELAKKAKEEQEAAERELEQKRQEDAVKRTQSSTNPAADSFTPTPVPIAIATPTSVADQTGLRLFSVGTSPMPTLEPESTSQQPAMPKCTSLIVSSSTVSAGSFLPITLNYTTNTAAPTNVKIWAAGSDDIGKTDAASVSSWIIRIEDSVSGGGTKPMTMPTEGLELGQHLIMAELIYDGVVVDDGKNNPSCVSSITIQ